ncbi:hypothetical protein [Micromonospora inositola]|uniref:Uncharacterized protein n=1 Tax=Micromonospora inositola TaxID=47865 RepID=A0A1C5K032_9ACTN|nr:hypothetical protein [Micromonospora inositola]SCG75879.1 hypothetical protein GA0070613_5872 [Micromonospora inositola]
MSSSIPGRRLSAVAAAVALIGAIGACGEEPVSPLPVQPSTAATTVTPSGPAGTPTTSRPAPVASSTATGLPRATPSPTPASACLGAIRYDLKLDEQELALLKSLCLATGGVLRLEGIGPGQVTVDRKDLASTSYEAGVVNVRFLRRGTVAVTIPHGGRTYTVTVVVR